METLVRSQTFGLFRFTQDLQSFRCDVTKNKNCDFDSQGPYAVFTTPWKGI